MWPRHISSIASEGSPLARDHQSEGSPSARRRPNLKINVKAVSDELNKIHHASDEAKATFDAQYEVFEVLGQGSSSVVKRGKMRGSGVDVALKMVRTSDPEVQKIARAEFDLARKFTHPNIIKVYDFIMTSSQTILVEELFSATSLQSVVQSAPRGRLQEETSRLLMLQLVEALDFLHSHRIIHRDVKPDNILVPQCLTSLKVIDFNVAKRLEEGGSLTRTGTAQYSAPEILLGQSASESADVWSAGLCLHYMMVGVLPFRIEDFNGSVTTFGEYIFNHPVTLKGSQWEEVSQPCKALLRMCLAVRMSARPAPMTLLRSEWLLPKDAFFVSASTDNSQDLSGLHMMPMSSEHSSKMSRSQSDSSLYSSSEFLGEHTPRQLQMVTATNPFSNSQGAQHSQWVPHSSSSDEQPPGQTLSGPSGKPNVTSQWSVGSELHGVGRCRPCAWLFKPQGCISGEACSFCHLCNQLTLKQQLANSLKKRQASRRTAASAAPPADAAQAAQREGRATLFPKAELTKYSL